MPLNAHVWPLTPAPSERLVSPTVVTTALKSASTSSVPKAATASVQRGERDWMLARRDTGLGLLGSMTEPVP